MTSLSLFKHIPTNQPVKRQRKKKKTYKKQGMPQKSRNLLLFILINYCGKTCSLFLSRLLYNIKCVNIRQTNRNQICLWQKKLLYCFFLHFGTILKPLKSIKIRPIAWLVLSKVLTILLFSHFTTTTLVSKIPDCNCDYILSELTKPQLVHSTYSFLK